MPEIKSIADVSPELGFAIKKDHLKNLSAAVITQEYVIEKAAGDDLAEIYQVLSTKEIEQIASSKENVLALLKAFLLQLNQFLDPENILNAINNFKAKNPNKEILMNQLSKLQTGVMIADRQVEAINPVLSQMVNIVKADYLAEADIGNALTALQKRVDELKSFMTKDEVLAKVEKIKGEL